MTYVSNYWGQMFKYLACSLSPDPRALLRRGNKYIKVPNLWPLCSWTGFMTLIKLSWVLTELYESVHVMVSHGQSSCTRGMWCVPCQFWTCQKIVSWRNRHLLDFTCQAGGMEQSPTWCHTPGHSPSVEGRDPTRSRRLRELRCTKVPSP